MMSMLDGFLGYNKIEVSESDQHKICLLLLGVHLHITECLLD